MMPRIWVSIGSNIERESHVRAALVELRALFGDLIVSPVYEAQAVGFDGPPFFNLVVGFDSELPPATLHGMMREIESRHGRDRGGANVGSRTLDLDVLTYGDQVTEEGGKPLPRDEILEYAFVLAPLADVAGGEQHPVLGESYADLWARMAAETGQRLQRVDGLTWLQD